MVLRDMPGKDWICESNKRLKNRLNLSCSLTLSPISPPKIARFPCKNGNFRSVRFDGTLKPQTLWFLTRTNHCFGWYLDVIHSHLGAS